MKTLLIVPASSQKAANEAAVAVAGPRAADTFSVGVVKGEGTKATHYVACWQMSKELLRRFRETLTGSKVIYENAGRAKLDNEQFRHTRK